MHLTICCEYLPHHDWMAFATWYSFYKYLPDAQVVVAIKRALPDRDLFHWPKKCNIPIKFYDGQLKNDTFAVSPTVMAVRDYDEKLFGPVSIKEDILATLVDYSEGCGKFVVSQWINRMYAPFFRARKMFFTESINANELAVLRLWEKMYSLYTSVKL
jgi:hypothetical protein